MYDEMQERPTHTILLVDDEPNVLSGLKRALRKYPYKILTAESGAEGLGILQKEKVDLIVADQDMPEMVGTEFLSLVAEKMPETVRFILTGKATLDVAVEAINSGKITQFLTKPCMESELITALSKALEHKDLVEQVNHLLRVTQAQSEVLDELERHHPEVMSVVRQEATYGEGYRNTTALIDAIRYELDRTNRNSWLPGRRTRLVERA